VDSSTQPSYGIVGGLIGFPDWLFTKPLELQQLSNADNGNSS